MNRTCANWLQCISDFDSWAKDWRKEAAQIVDRFEDGKTQYNVLYGNTETLFPAVYSSTPKPQILNRFYREDPMSTEYAKGAEKYLSLLVDSQQSDIEPLSSVMEDAIYDALLPGIGTVRVKYKAKLATVDAKDPNTGQPIKAQIVQSEYVCYEPVAWNKIRWGRAKRWAGVPWVSFEYWMDKAELVERFTEAVVKKMALTDGTSGQSSSDKDQGDDQLKRSLDDAKGKVTGAFVFEIWDKKSKKVMYVSPQLPGEFLRVDEDTYKLDGFYPCPQPLLFLRGKKEFEPVPLYRSYRKHAEELTKLTIRITKLIEACKARGVYDATIGNIEKALKSEEGVLVPSDRMMGGQTKLDNAIWFMPIERIVNAIVQLNGERERVKQIIYEVTGIADLIRGASQASESATAQRIKNQWGTLRIKRLQREVQRFVKDLFRLALDLTTETMAPQTVAKMIGVRPEAMGQFQALWEQFKDDKFRSYSVDIETDSTLDEDATQDKEDIRDALMALSQTLNGIGPLVQQGTMPAEAAQQIMLMIARRYKFGREIEEYLRAMQPPPPKPDPKADAEKAKMEAEQQRFQLETQKMQQQLDHDREMMEMERQERAEKLQFERERMNLEREKLGIKMQTEVVSGQIKINNAQALSDQKIQVGQAVGDQKVMQAKQMAAVKPKPQPKGATRAPA